jgi:hypothetical protein
MGAVPDGMGEGTGGMMKDQGIVLQRYRWLSILVGSGFSPVTQEFWGMLQVMKFDLCWYRYFLFEAQDQHNCQEDNHVGYDNYYW